MQTTAVRKTAIYIKETAGYHPEENSKELQQHGTAKSSAKPTSSRSSPATMTLPGIRHDFEWMMGEATQDEPPFQYIVVYKLRNFSWSLDETVLCRDRLRASGVTLVSTMESSP